jgi:hypothetical protein
MTVERIAMNGISVGLYSDPISNESSALIWIILPGVLENNIRRVNSWEEIETIAANYGIAGRDVAFGAGVVDWCTEKWGAPRVE